MDTPTVPPFPIGPLLLPADEARMLKMTLEDRRTGDDRRDTSRDSADRRVQKEPVYPTSVRIPASVYDEVCQTASKEGISVHALLLRRIACSHYRDSE